MPSVFRLLCFRLLFSFVCTVLIVANAHAQILQGEWVDRSQAAIEQHRKTSLVVVVLDENDRAVRDAQVHIEQRRHDFILGINLGVGQPPLGDAGELPLWRCFNAFSLDRLTDWRRAAPLDAAALDTLATTWHDWMSPVEVSYGPVLSADPARGPDPLITLDTARFRAAIDERTTAAFRIDAAVNRFDLYADAGRHTLLEDRLGTGVLNALFDTADARRPDAAICLRVRDGLDMNRSLELRRTIRALEIRQVRFDGLTIDQSFPGRVNAITLERTLNERIASLDVPITLMNLNFGGTSNVAAAINLETVLRLVFATPNIRGLYFAGLYADDVTEPVGALLDPAGDPTVCAQLIEGLFRELWWTDLSQPSDDLGNVKAQVFCGWYHITATLPDGTVLQTEAYLPKQDEPRYIVLQAGPRE